MPPYQDLFIYYIKGCARPDPVIDDTDFIGVWEEEEDSFLFFKKSSDAKVNALLDRQPHMELIDRFEMTYEQWQGGAVAPFKVGAVHVMPPWNATAQNDNMDSILLDPGVVFGAGTHPTTQDCLMAVQLALAKDRVGRVLDLGTGTGLLALAAIRLGGETCVALDLNRLAVETAWRNVRLNKMDEQILVVQGDAKNFIDLPCDLMISNIHYDVMHHFLAGNGFWASKQFILSGLLRSQARKVEARLMNGLAIILEKWERDGIWTTFYGETTGR
jgi:ribosomal protein L11 methyltransferase